MAKFATAAPPNVTSPVRTEGRMATFEGGAGWVRDAKSDLFLLAVTNMVAETTFYESAGKRDARFVDLIHRVTREDPDWVAQFVPWLRDTAQMRSASLVVAAEYVKAGGPNGRQVISAALRRADEPAEMLGYWHQTYGRRVPQPVKRGVADAVARLYNERAALRYDGTQRAWRFGDVLELVHPKPEAVWQAALFRYLLDARHGREDLNTELLPTIAADRALAALPESERRAALGGMLMGQAGWSWERLSGWLPGGMDAAAWTSVIPNMGYMALLRNLRNFDTAGIDDLTALQVCNRLMAADEVVRSRQFPIRFLSAYREAGSLRWAYALERALDHSLANVPALPGRTLVLIDWSGSMWSGISGRSKRQRWEVATIFGAALAKRAEHADVVAYGSSAGYLDVAAPLLRILETARGLGGTQTMQTLRAAYKGHDRVVIVTDEQAHDAGNPIPEVPLIYTFNVAGYAPAHLPSGDNGRYTFGGLTDAAFQLIPIIEAQRDGHWLHMEEG